MQKIWWPLVTGKHPPCRIDHLTVTAASLEAGVAWVSAQLGVPLQPGGEHVLMGTHNRLLRLGPRCYLEVIAPAPHLAAPERPRWFALDDPAMATPALRAWVARSVEIEAAAARLQGEVGTVCAMSRGDLLWQISIPEDGRMPWGGVLPMLIEWPEGIHPAERLPDQGVRLLGLHWSHPQASAVQALLDTLPLQDACLQADTPEAMPRLRARVLTPAGERWL
ncbi:VOC family protein [Leeia sp. IMCC25680]|uniref:VOC family protein n=1 Tax=Leeia aquatica TaxID=2725557 RepID=A0A847S1F8_9NEIS|nr:VOC family protein [Leeia aquatica]